MPGMPIEDVPPDTHGVLRARAAAAHRSLQEFPLRHRIDEVVALLQEDRDRR